MSNAAKKAPDRGSWLKNLFASLPWDTTQRRRLSSRRRLMLEQLEGREVPALVSSDLLALPEAHRSPVARHLDTDSAAVALVFKVNKGATITGTEQKALNAIVATFTGAPGAYKAKIVWGDGSTTVGKIAPQPHHEHSFTVTGAHTYRRTGSFAVSVTVTSPRHKAATVKISARISEAAAGSAPTETPPASQPPMQTPSVIPPLVVNGLSLASKAGNAFSGTVATFTPLAGTAAGDYSASINWGDGHQTAGTIGADASGVLAVSGSNTYATGGGYPISVSVTGGGSQGATGQAEAVIQFPASLTAHGVGVTAVSDQSFTQTVAVFTPDGGDATGFSAKVDWGDGQTSDGAIQPDATAGNFDVNGTHSYGSAGNFAVQVTITGPGSVGQVVQSGADVVDPGQLSIVGLSAVASAGSAFTGTIANFSPPAGQANGYTASIDWGDGHNGPGTIQAGASTGSFDIVGTNTYAAAGSFTANITLQAPDNSMTTVQAGIDVSAAGALSAQPVDVATSAGQAFTGPVAICTLPGGSSTGFSATINWGDTHSSAGTFTPDPDTTGAFDVVGTNTYATGGSFNISVSIQGPNNLSASVAPTATVTTPDKISALAMTIKAAAGQTFNGVVATFSIPGAPAPGTSSAMAADVMTLDTSAAPGYAANIQWGDGQSSFGTIQDDPNFPGLFDVVGSNLYAKTGSFTVSVTITGPAGSVTVGKSSAVAIPVTIAQPQFNATAGQPFSGKVTTFTAPGGTAANYKATIQWGDGHQTPGRIVVLDAQAGSFEVDGNNTYATSGPATVNVTVKGTDGGGAVGQNTVTIADLGMSAVGFDITAGAGQQATKQVANFTVTNGQTTGFSATIDWGDGQVTSGRVIQDSSVAGLFEVLGTITYEKAGSYTIHVRIDGNNGSVTTDAHTATVSLVLTTTRVGVPAVVGTEFTSGIGSVSEAGVDASNFSGTIDWRDGQSSPATIVPDPIIQDQYDIIGTHTYTSSAGFQPLFTVTGKDGSTGNDNGNVFVKPPSTLTVHPLTVPVTVNAEFQANIATVTIPGGPTPDLQVTIDYGTGPLDRQTFDSSVFKADAAGTDLFDISTLFEYAKVGTFPITVSIDSGNGTSAIGVSQANVTGAGSTDASGSTFTNEPAVGFSGVVAVLHVPGSSGGLPQIYVGNGIIPRVPSIDWGDGQTSDGSYQQDPSAPDTWDIVGSNTYAAIGKYTVTTTVLNTARGTPLLVMHGVAKIAELTWDPTATKQSFTAVAGAAQTQGVDPAISTPSAYHLESLAGDPATQFPASITPTVVNALDTPKVRQAQTNLFNALGPSGLNVLDDGNKDGVVDANDVQLTVVQTSFTFDIHLKKADAVANVPFGLGLPDSIPLQLDASGKMNVALVFRWELKFGQETPPGAQNPITFINPSPLTLGVEATIPGLDLIGKFGFADVEVKDDTNTPSSLDADYVIDLKVEPTDVQVGLSQTLKANLNLDLTGTLGDPLNNRGLSFGGKLQVAWNAPTLVPVGGFGPPTVNLAGVQLNAGPFVASILKPVVEKIQPITRPLQPIVDFLTKPLPILSELNGGNSSDPKNKHNVSFATGLTGVGAQIQPFIDAINRINQIQINSVTGNIDVGGFDLTDPSHIVATASPDGQSQLNTLAPALAGLSKLGFEFPILTNPVQLAALLLPIPDPVNGGVVKADIVTWTTPKVDLNAPVSKTFYPVLDLPLFFVKIGGNLHVEAQATFGFDSLGFQLDHSLLDGFYVKTDLLDTSHHPIIAAIVPSLNASVGLGSGDVVTKGFSIASILSAIGLSLDHFVSLSVTGTLFGIVDISLTNQNASGVTRLDNIDFANPIQVSLDPNGMEFSLGFSAALSIGIPDGPLSALASAFHVPNPIEIGVKNYKVGTWALWPSFHQVL